MQLEGALSLLAIHATNSITDMERRRAAGESIGSEDVESWLKSALAYAEKVLPDCDDE